LLLFGPLGLSGYIGPLSPLRFTGFHPLGLDGFLAFAIGAVMVQSLMQTVLRQKRIPLHEDYNIIFPKSVAAS
jgi:hypothetical protein